MGRHSAPDDDTVDSAQASPVRVDEIAAGSGSRPRPARHAEPPAEPAAVASVVAPVAEPEAYAEPIVRNPPIGRTAPHAAGPAGKPRPGGVLRPAAARSGPPPREAAQAPPRADDDTSPGLALIERAMTGARTDPVETVPVPDIPQEARPQGGHPQGAEPRVATDRTVQIKAIADPVLDEAVPEAVTEQLRPVQDHPAGAPVAPGRAPSAEPSDAGGPPENEGGKADGRTSDLALLRSDSAVRARVLAALVVPFLLYVSVLLIVDSLDVRTALIWIWIPLVTAGVVGGLLLDIAHRDAAAEPADDAGPPAAP